MDRSSKTKIAIVGGGIQGLALAYFLSKDRGRSITIYERNQNLGGLLGLLDVQGVPIEGFYHHWFTSHRDILNLAKELGLDGELIYKKNKIGLFYQNKIFPFTGVTDLLRFAPLSFIQRIRLGFSTLKLMIVKNPERFEKIRAVEWLKKNAGEDAYRVVWEPLLEGKFGKYKNDISMAWFWGRVHERGNSPFLIYPRGGFKRLIDEMVKVILEGGHLVKTNSVIQEIRSENNNIVIVSDSKEETFDKVFVTTPITVFLKLTKGLSQDYISNLEKIRYRAAHIAFLVLNHSLMPQGYYWLNINDRNIPLLAVIEHTNLIPKEVYGNKHILYLGSYPDPGDSIMSMTQEEIIDFYSKFLPRINPDFKKEWIEERHIFKDPYAQPVVDIYYKEKIPPYETPLSNLYLVTMAQIYPWDRGTSNAVRQAKEVIEKYVERIL